MASSSSLSLSFTDEPWDWRKDTLWDFTYGAGNLPVHYAEFFAQPDTEKEIAAISNQLQVEAKTLPIYPLLEDVFRALSCRQPKVVVISQDPYHQPSEKNEYAPLSAVGIAFGLPPGATYINPSLQSIHEEVAGGGFAVNPKSGNLAPWVEQGVVLLNSALTVPMSLPGRHIKIWSRFTELLIEYLSRKHRLVWLLWGRPAQSYESSILEPTKHCILRSSHPSPLSASKPCGSSPPFLGSTCFNRANMWLKAQGRSPIDWSIP